MVDIVVVDGVVIVVDVRFVVVDVGFVVVVVVVGLKQECCNSRSK